MANPLPPKPTSQPTNQPTNKTNHHKQSQKTNDEPEKRSTPHITNKVIISQI